MSFAKLTEFLNRFGLLKHRYLKACFRYDCKKFEKYSGLDSDSTDVKVAEIRILCHTIEKALSLSDCRDDFGKEKIQSLISLYTSCKESSSDKNAIELCESIIYNYYQFRLSKGLDVSFIPEPLRSYNGSVKSGAQKFISIHTNNGFDAIAHARHSVRDFYNQPVKESEIIKAVTIAQTAPSACNRQATRIYACVGPSKIKAIQSSHGGIRAFGNPGVIFAIAQDMRLYLNEYERNTWLIDAGIFCMNMLYSLQSIGIGACPIIWGGMKDEDQRIARLFGIPENERVAVLIVGGYPPEEGCHTPISSKRPLCDILHIIQQ